MQPETLEERTARLEKRLQDGFAKIGEALSHGSEVDNWEAHFATLLAEYVALEDVIAAHHAETVQSVMELGVREVRDVA